MDKVSKIKSLDATASIEFSIKPLNPKSLEVYSLSIGNPVVASAHEPRGDRFTLL